MSGLIIDFEGLELTNADREVLQNENVVGCILFTRNYRDHDQLRALVKSIREAVQRPFLISVDHEGGHVQRFRDGFSAIPAMVRIFERNGELSAASAEAEQLGFLMAAELREFDIDLSYAPVLDVLGPSTVIGDRAFAAEPERIIALAKAFIAGMARAGMRCVGKHFPGHGTVVADSHIDIPTDERSFAEIENHDLLPFQALADKLDAIMPAHVVYPAVDALPAGFSPFWLQRVLREQLSYHGVIISDDLLMEGARVVGDVPARARAAFAAGGELLLVCNNRVAVNELLADLHVPQNARGNVVERLLGLPFTATEQDWQNARAVLALYS
ncbi:beta-N-acetylhexosaminidase [Aliidiomarina celeris]|uniref:beta-N-acetylhexosaminidase n=1 Tax=Aliidiomarina celeris TaxID=2249428 RepID=UPI000DE824A2|nr:beta-N-acetylhexosaminidase [Aliidiomarina celeris]